MSTFVRPRPVAWLFFLAALFTTVGLGTWQVQRMEWKEGLIAEIETAKKGAPLSSIPTTDAELDAKNFYPVQVSGTWISDREFHISPRFFNGKLGYFVVTPMTLEDGRTLLVNRGWIPARQKNPLSRPESAVAGDATISGLLRVGDDRNGLTPDNSPDKNIWFGRDASAMGDYAKLPNTIPAMLDIVGTQDAKMLPVPSDGTIRLRNDHLSYIFTWYGIAVGILIIFIVYHRKPR